MKTQELTPKQRSQLFHAILLCIAGAFMIAGTWSLLDQLIKDTPHPNTVEYNATFANVTYAVIIVVVLIAVMVAIYAYKKFPVPSSNSDNKSRSEQ
jgi:drug/metabolite transporter (DMT)-like permease